MNNEGLLLVLSGPSGSGKDTIIKKLFDINTNIAKSISMTTRPARKNEIDKKDYIFVSEKDFNDIISNEGMLEYTQYCGNYYGTLKKSVDSLMKDGKDVLLKIDVNGAKQIKRKCNKSVSIFILPPSIEVLSSRLVNRSTETDESLKRRLKRAEQEIESSYIYDYIVVNDNVDNCVRDICNIINAEKLKTSRMKNIINGVLSQCKDHQ